MEAKTVDDGCSSSQSLRECAQRFYRGALRHCCIERIQLTLLFPFVRSFKLICIWFYISCRREISQSDEHEGEELEAETSAEQDEG